MKPVSQMNKILFMAVMTLIIIALIIIVLLPNESLERLVPEPEGDLYIKQKSDPERSAKLMQEISAQEALVTTYGIKGLDNSDVRLELLRYSQEDFPQYLENHLAGETIFVGGTEIELPCENIPIEGITVKLCKYESNDFSVIKHTFPLEPDIIVRVLCTEASVVTADIHCRQISTRVIEKGT